MAKQNQYFYLTVIFIISLSCAKATELDYDADVADDGRQIIIGTGGTVTLNLTQLATLLPLLALPLLTALALTGLGFLIWALVENKHYGSGSGYSGSGHDGGYSSYSSYRRSFNTFDGINWEQFTILDFLAIAEDAYRNFDPANLSCQQRLICEIHQNADTMGASAKTMVDWLSYLQYAEVLSLPEEVKALAEEYLDAADRGRNKEKECGVVYDGCNFSIKKLMKNLSHNEIKK